MQVCSQNAILKLIAVTLATMPIVILTGLAFAAFTKRNIWRSMLATFEVLERLPGALMLLEIEPLQIVSLAK